MKIRLFCFVTAFLIVAGLLLPVSVHADDGVSVDVVTDLSGGDGVDLGSEICVTPGDANGPSLALEEEVGVGESDQGATDANNQCGNGDGSYLRVSWNS